MHFAKNDKGYTLVLAIAIITLFMVLSLSLMTLTISGAKKSKMRETSTQAQNLAVKGIDYAVERIQTSLNEEISGGKNASEFKTILENTLDQYSCKHKKINLPDTSTGNAEVCIQSYSDLSETNPYKKLVTFEGIGSAEGKTEKVRSAYEIGADLELEMFDYALSTFKKNNNGGNLSIHGGVEVHGNMNIDGNLYASDKSRYKTRTVHSVLPRAYNSNMNLTGNSIRVYKPFQMEGHLAPVSEMFHPSAMPANVPRDVIHPDFNIGQIIDNFKFDKNSDGVTLMKVGNLENKGTNIGAWNLKSNAEKVVLKFLGKTDYDWTIWGKNRFKAIAFPKDLKIKYDPSILTDPEFTVTNWAYIGADMEIGLHTSNELTHLLETDVTINGAYFVNDDLRINTARLTGHAVFFVRDKVEIEFSQLDGTFFIFANGPVTIKYVANNHNERIDSRQRSYINGFIFSNDSITIDGATSLLTINGGLSANNIYVTSIRGRAIELIWPPVLNHGLQSYWSGLHLNYFEKAENQNKDRIKIGLLLKDTIDIESRLQIRHDPVALVNYLDVMRINKIDKPVEIEREFVNP